MILQMTELEKLKKRGFMYDIITIGSATFDVFVRTNKAATRFALMKSEHDVCYPIGGKVLIDELHFDTGGAGTNTAVAFSRLGLRTAYLGKLGTDINSQHILSLLHKEKVTFLGNTAHGMTGYSVILIGLEKDRTILAYKGINDDLKKTDIPFPELKTRWLYFGSMLGTSFKTLCTLAQFARKHHIPYAFNPSTYLARQGFKTLKPIIHGCHVLILNKEEAQLVAPQKNIKALLTTLQKHARTVVITQGKEGAYSYDGKEYLYIKPRKTTVIETTGAGDAFASGVVFGISQHKPLRHALSIGLAEAESVIQHIGAKNKLLTLTEIERSLSQHPPNIEVI